MSQRKVSQTLKLNDGNEMPLLGIGTWQALPGEVTEAVKTAIGAGYRHIDGASFYQNESEVGAGIKAKLADVTVTREELFVVSKLWGNAHHPDAVLPALKKTLSDLDLTYLNLYLIHFPIPLKTGEELIPQDEAGAVQVDNDIDLAETWKKMEECVRLGLTKSIGISNFNSQQIEYILKNCTIKPVTNQIEIHPYFVQSKLVEFCQSKDISITGYSPFRSPNRPTAKPDDPKLLEEPILIEIGKKYGKLPSHVILRWMFQKNIAVIPKSFTKSRIIDNFNIFDFTLSEEDIKGIESLDKGPAGRVNTVLDFKESKGWPFNIPY